MEIRRNFYLDKLIKERTMDSLRLLRLPYLKWASHLENSIFQLTK